MRQSIRFVTTPDGVRGPAVVKTPNWLTHLEFDLASPGWVHWLEFIFARRTLYRMDQRGSGLSDWCAADLSFDRWVEDLECVVDAAGLTRFSLLGISQGDAVAIEYAARHPDKVERLVLFGAYARGWARRGDPVELRQGRALLDLIETGWGSGNIAYLQLFTNLFMPDATEPEHAWFNELQRVSTRPDIAARLVAAAGEIDVSHRLADVKVPTLVAHAREDARVPFEEGRLLAAAIPGARLVPLEGRNHVLLQSAPAWRQFRDALDAFVPVGAPPGRTSFRLDELTVREREIFDYVLQGLGNAGIAARAGISEKTVRNHLTSIFSKLGVRNRSEASVAARDHLVD